jgi:hypothetical protein
MCLWLRHQNTMVNLTRKMRVAYRVKQPATMLPLTCPHPRDCDCVNCDALHHGRMP